jgi:hypothetical protein
MAELDPRTYQAIAVKRAISFWIKHSMKVNRAYTPTNMARTAGHITGKTYGRTKKELQRAHDDLAAMLEPPVQA